MLKRFAFILLLLPFFYSTVGVGGAYALTEPSFPTCVNPQGTIRVSYSLGNHGIVGKTTLYRGSDAVYTLTSDTLMQCFCPDSGQDAIQTNWWKISSLTLEELKFWQSNGWTLIPDGSLWGLDKAPYLAKNYSYSCNGRGIGGGSDGDVSNASSSTNSKVLSLANTGDLQLIFSLFMLGFLLLAGGRLVSRRK